MSASRYVINENRRIAKKTAASGAGQSRSAGRLNRLLGDVARSLELEAMSRFK